MMIQPRSIPNGLDEIREVYGNPDLDGDWILDPGWLGHNTSIFTLPMTFRTWGNRTTKVFRAHTLVGPSIRNAMCEIINEVGEDRLRAEEMDFWGGCWWFRKMRNHDALSTHSWGIAVDLNPGKCPMGASPDNQLPEIVTAFKKRGFDWGGDWDYPDGHHFQAARNY